MCARRNMGAQCRHSADAGLFSFPADITIYRQWSIVIFSKELLNKFGQSHVRVSRGSSTQFSFKLLSHSEILLCSSFRVLAEANIKINIFWDVRPCSLVNRYQCFWRKCCHHFEAEERVTSQLKKEWRDASQLKKSDLRVEECGFSQLKKTDLQSRGNQTWPDDTLWVLYPTSLKFHPSYMLPLIPWWWRQHVPLKHSYDNHSSDRTASHPSIH
jgi:hypothetical protein